MDVSYLLDELNPAQREAVAFDAQHLLVLAGAGSGKTRVLAHRIAWLVQVENVPGWNILAVTFTNKAAREMRTRIEHLLGRAVGAMWVGTFHGLAHRLLRAHYQDVDLPSGFQILDSDDQLRLLKRVLKSLGLDEARWPARQAQWFINSSKDEGVRSHQLEQNEDPFTRQMSVIYREYEAACRRSGLVDFTELLLRAYELWCQRPEILTHYRERFQHVLVDEFQDTNRIQYAWLKQLNGEHNHFFAVGDDDQSIYGWRGARVEHIRGFQEDFSGTQLIRLEQNYRSTSTILDAANAVIANNASRIGKNLWTTGSAGEQIRLYAAYNELDEARYVIDTIELLLEVGDYRRCDIALLYRTTAQSRLLEEGLWRNGISYRVYGGMRFFERAEIKDVLAYLRLIANRDDDAAFERAVNLPPRGLGAKTLERLREAAKLSGVSLWRAAHELLVAGVFTARTTKSLQGFIHLIEEADATHCPTLQDRVADAIARSRLREHFATSRDGKGQDRLENLDELVNAAREFHKLPDEEQALGELEAFLAQAALEAGDNQARDGEDSVQLMTLHSAKGLEFPQVFICGLEEGLFPHAMSSEEPAKLEEERRLCYVGMTRAMRRLTLSYAESRRLHGNETYPLPSRFLREIPSELIEEVRPRPKVSRPYSSPHTLPGTESAFRLGQRVQHAKFGQGVVLGLEGDGASARIQVNFEHKGVKWLVISYANLEPV